MDMASAHVEHAANVALGIDHFAYAARIHELQLGVPVTFPERLLGFQMLHLLGGHRCKYTAVLEVAVDVVARYAVANDARTLKGHLSEQAGLFLADGALDHVDVPTVAVDDLAAVATGGAKADARCFQQGHLETLFQQEQCGGYSGIAGPDHADIGLVTTLQSGSIRGRIGGGGVIRGGMVGVSHGAP